MVVSIIVTAFSLMLIACMFAIQWYQAPIETSGSNPVDVQDETNATRDLKRLEEPHTVRSLRKAAELGDSDAMLKLGARYAAGQGVPLDDAQAVRWYRKAAELGDSQAMFALGVMYRSGPGVPQDDAEAYVWASLAVAFGERNKAVELRDLIAEDLTPSARLAAQARAEKLFKEIQQRIKE